jgi:hypothetical protein
VKCDTQVRTAQQPRVKHTVGESKRPIAPDVGHPADEPGSRCPLN